MSAKLGSEIEPNSEEPTHNLTIKKDAMIQALTTSLGNVTEAAEKIGIRRETHYAWLKDDAEYSAAVASLKNVALDFAESQLKKLISCLVIPQENMKLLKLKISNKNKE